ncbi:MAG TPA: CoA transferase [Candidatus Kryptonia bacterium]|nr:CoA transferase [Candidatus Kryptonia bacterium]
MKTRGALAGIRIVECAQDIAGPYAAMLLAEQGAEVVKVEPPGGDRARVLPGFHVWNRSKRTTVADLAADAGRDRLRRLCAGADVFISDWFADDAALRYETLAANNPRLIHCWMPPYGGRGESARALAHNDLVAARGALMASQWAHREGPVFLTLPVASYGTAMLAAGAVCAALLARARDGRGQQVEVSWLAGALAMQTGSIVDHPALQRVMQMVRDPLGVIPIYRLFKASDDWLFIACGNPTFFNKLCLVFERPELVSDPRFDGAPWAISPAYWAEIKALVQSIVETRPRAEWLRLLDEADIPCAPVMSRADFLTDPQVQHLGLCPVIDDPQLGRTIQMGVPVNLRDTPGAIRNAAPRLEDAVTIDEWRLTPTLRDTPSARRKSNGPLDGRLVLDFTSYIAGPSAAMQLALAGADVIKIEPPGGDPFRAFGFGFYGWNQNKRGLALDFSKPEARAIVHELVRTADVIVENLRPGATRRLGVDYETVAALNPRLVYGSITAFGSSGPRGHEAGFDPLLQARSGIMAAQGGHGGDPVFLACAVCDYAVGLLCAFGVMAALYTREQSGRGQLVETSLAQAALAVQSGEFLFYDGRPDMENGGPDLIGRNPLRRAYRCSDGWIFVSAGAEQLGNIASALDISLSDEKSRAQTATDEPADGATGTRLAEALASRTRGDVLRGLAAARVPAAVVLNVAELFHDPQVAANGLLHAATAAHWGEFRQTGTLVKYAATPVRIARAAPQLGEHTDDILSRVLGYAPARIADLRARGVLAG